MSAVRLVALACDVRGWCSNESDYTGTNVRDARRANPDWHVSNGKDVCPRCWAEGWRWGRDGKNWYTR